MPGWKESWRVAALDAYHAAFPNYFYCGICEFEDASLVLLSEKLWASEVIRRVRPVLKKVWKYRSICLPEPLSAPVVCFAHLSTSVPFPRLLVLVHLVSTLREKCLCQVNF